MGKRALQDEPNCCLDALQTAALWLHASGMQEGLKPISEVEGETKKKMMVRRGITMLYVHRQR